METATVGLDALRLTAPGTRVLSHQRYETDYQGEHIAVTIIAENEEISPEERSQMAVEEFNLHVALRETVLAEFIPEPLFLVQDKYGQNIGFAVKVPRDGWYIQHPITFRQNAFLTQEKYTTLVVAVGKILCNLNGPFFDPTMLHATNLQTDGRKVWFTSCSAAREGTEVGSLQQNARQILATLLRYVAG